MIPTPDLDARPALSPYTYPGRYTVACMGCDLPLASGVGQPQWISPCVCGATHVIVKADLHDLMPDYDAPDRVKPQ